ncbi:MAG: hypothetical protein ABIA67_02895, partial [Candidatus Margulisiibacteriota bacterium]
FKPESIDKLFEKEVLKAYASGRYFYEKKLDSRDNWRDLLINIFTAPVTELDYLRDPEALKTEQERIEIIKDINSGLRRLKIIEDWLYSHPEELQKLSDWLNQNEDESAIQKILESLSGN